MSTTKYNPAMGARARKRREELGLDTKQLAHALDITSTRLNQMESDGVQSIDLARVWADALSMDCATLIFGEAEKRRKAGGR